MTPLATPPPGKTTGPHKTEHRPRFEAFQTTVMVVLFTGLIWWNANELVRSGKSVKVRVRVVTDPGVSARILSADEFTATLSGSRRLLDELSERLRVAGDILEYRLPDDDAKAATERFERAAKDVLANTGLVERSGVAVTDALPPVVAFTVDRLEKSAMPVETAFGSVEVGGVSVSPTSVTVTMPKRDLAKFAKKISLNLESQIRRWRKDSPNESTFTLSVAVPLPPHAERVEPPNVTVTGTMVQLLAQSSKGPVEVLPAIPASVQRDYLVEPIAEGGFRTDLTIRGAKDDLAALTPEQIRAYFDVLTADAGLAGQTIARRIVVILPKGFELVGEPPEVSFRLVAKATTESDTP